ncbi:MAG TPA: four helix bundle protein [Ferruginibacter sp.]|nr:four helix bundle protein [Ferruginibacter sp.]HRE64153.1 four helix bundle protein [Ferruginibacter sp.]
MKADNPIETKSFEFAVRVVKLYKHLTETKKEFVLSKQLLRSGTSIGANVSEGLQGMSKKDFVAKLSHCIKGGAGN